MKLRRAAYLIVLILALSIEHPGRVAARDGSGEKVARVGVLAFRGAETAKAHWTPLAHYLTAAIEGWRFEPVPVTLVSAPDKINDKQIDFLITNPGHYVALAADHALSVLATRERRATDTGQGLMHYGTVIFTRRQSGIRTLDDLRARRLAAVSPEAFGGFQMAWYEMQRQNIDAFHDLEAIGFMGFPQDAIVAAVLNGEVDAGVVRSGLLENLAAEGRLDIRDVTVLHGNTQLEYPYQVSGRLYPEWPFTALPGADKALREAVARALLATQDPEIAGPFELLDLWSAPLAYEDVRHVVAAYRSRALGSDSDLQPLTDLQTISMIVFSGLAAATLLWLLFGVRPGRRIDVAERPGPAEQAAAASGLTGKEVEQAVSRFETLTRREREILSLICAGQPSKTIAADLGISPKTVEFHRANLLQKTAAGTTAHLVQLAARLGYDQGFSLGSTR